MIVYCIRNSDFRVNSNLILRPPTQERETLPVTLNSPEGFFETIKERISDKMKGISCSRRNSH